MGFLNSQVTYPPKLPQTNLLDLYHRKSKEVGTWKEAVGESQR